MVTEPDPPSGEVQPAVGTPSAGAGRRALAAIVALALAWFAIMLLVLRAPVLDAVGAAVGGVLAVLVVVSVVGTARQVGRD